MDANVLDGEYLVPFTWGKKIALMLLMVLYRLISFMHHVVYFYFYPFALPIAIFIT